MRDKIAWVITLLCTGALLTILVVSGYFACSLPATTVYLADKTSDDVTSPYEKSDLVKLAALTRTYTIDGMSDDDYDIRLVEIARHSGSTSDHVKQFQWSHLTRSVKLYDTDRTPLQIGYDMRAFEKFSLTPDARAHLSDVNMLISDLMPLVILSVVLSVLLLATLIFCGYRRLAAYALMAAPGILALSLALLGIWGTLDFNGLFSAFHGVLFPQGNWTFSYDSLLICMYPINFWVDMASVWLAVSLTGCIMSGLCGYILWLTDRKHRKSLA